MCLSSVFLQPENNGYLDTIKDLMTALHKIGGTCMHTPLRSQGLCRSALCLRARTLCTPTYVLVGARRPNNAVCSFEYDLVKRRDIHTRTGTCMTCSGAELEAEVKKLTAAEAKLFSGLI